MTEDDDAPRTEGNRAFNPRMHQGGKLAFRQRVNPTEVDPGAFVVHGGANPPALRALVPAGFADVEIEVGSGKGAFLVAATEARPRVFHLGIEAAPAYAEFAADRLKKSGRTNGLLLVDNGKLFLQDRVEPGELAALHVYFPDPWPKRRHKGRRFFTDEVPATVARALRADGWLYVATDNAAYAGQVCRVVGSSPWFERDEAEEQRLQQLGPGHAFSPTNFERKYIEEGRVIRRYAFRKVATPQPA
ncbi:MAG: tRNA ((46)-N7)-methyltransferase TrmB [Planctomycetota bacterium]|jgi:tRNA (guanine-N7-)-methyltransferase